MQLQQVSFDAIQRANSFDSLISRSLALAREKKTNYCILTKSTSINITELIIGLLILAFILTLLIRS